MENLKKKIKAVVGASYNTKQVLVQIVDLLGADSIEIAADVDSDLEAGNLQDTLVALSERIKALEEA